MLILIYFFIFAKFLGCVATKFELNFSHFPHLVGNIHLQENITLQTEEYVLSFVPLANQQQL